MDTLAAKTFLVTGATDGIGKITAQALAQQGAQVIIHGRNSQKAEETRQAIIASTGNERVNTALADLSDLTQVRILAAELHARYPRLDGLINNAGVLLGSQRQISAQGYELTLATNYLGPFLLTNLLLDLLQASPAGRIVNVSSTAYRYSRPDLDDLQATRRYSPYLAYGNTKLWTILFTQELARRLRTHDIPQVTANALHPGIIATRFGGAAWWSWYMLLARLHPHRVSPTQGAQTSLFLATDPSVATISGSFFDQQKLVPVNSEFNTPIHAKRLWQLSEELTGAPFLT